jgi:hypothetical protein
MLRFIILLLVWPVLVHAEVSSTPAQMPSLNSSQREGALLQTRWNHMAGHAQWNAEALRALENHGRALTSVVPEDINEWCPYYEQASEAQRRAFWVGFMSALAKYESTYKPGAVGGGGRWFGLLQILPATARGYDCVAGTGEALKDGGANLSCAVRIMAHTVPRDGVIAQNDGRWGGVAADWGPMRDSRKTTEMANWLKEQAFCQAPATREASLSNPRSVEISR